VSALAEAARFQSRIDADLARLMIENEGIDAFLFDAEINSMYGGLFMPVRLMVPADDLAQVRAILTAAGLS
jgi:hypothetical protein